MRLSLAVAALSSLVASVVAETHLVLVGDGGLTFNPPSVTAAQGDIVSFEFRAKNHSVTQSTFADPCKIMTTPQPGVNSGFQAVKNGTTTFAQWSFTVDNGTAPLWFYCAQKTPVNHCQMGMVFAVNPSADKTYEMYLANAKASSSGAAPGGGYGAPGASGAAGATGAAGASGAAGALQTSLSSVPLSAVTNTQGGPVPSPQAASGGTIPNNGAVRMGSHTGLFVVAALVVRFIL
jgi:plastocyanin